MKILLISLALFLTNLNENGNASSPVKLTYLTRSGWLAETENHLLLFDYVPYEGKNFDDFVQAEFDKAAKNKKSLL